MLQPVSKSINLVSQEDLATITGYTKPAEIAACLSRQGVKYLAGKRGRIFTTVSALEEGMGLGLERISITGAQSLSV